MKSRTNPIKKISTAKKIAVPGVYQAFTDMQKLSFDELIDLAHDQARDEDLRNLQQR